MNERTEHLLLRLGEIEERIRDLKAGVTNGIGSCDEALVRISEIQAALRDVSGGLFEDHWRRCVVRHIRAGDADAVERFMRSVAKVVR